MINLAIIGGGPAGLASGLYASRSGISNVVMFEKGMPGGQITTSSEIENYPGVSKVVSGLDFMDPWLEQCFRFGLQHEMIDVVRVSKLGDTFSILLGDGTIREARAVIIATGGSPKRANIKGEDIYFGRGVSTCATCDGFFHKNKEVAVLGGGDTALEEAIYLAKLCSKVYLIHRRDAFRAVPVTVNKVKAEQKIELITPAIIEEIKGDDTGLTSISIDHAGAKRNLNLSGLFVFVGFDLNTQILFQEDGAPLCDLDPYGAIKVNLNMETSIPGLYAAGDIRTDAKKQVVASASDGAVAALQAMDYLESKS